MRRSNHKTNNQYYPDLTRSNFTSLTSRRPKSSAHHDMNDTKTKFNARLQKACPTMSTADINKQFNLYRKQMERLQKQMLKKDKIIFENKATFNFNKELQAQLIETYRIIYLYQGKMIEYEKELKRLQQTISLKMEGQMAQKVEELLQSYRKQNGQLRGQVQEKNRLLFQLETKIKKLENKYFTTSWKLSSTKRQILNPLHKKFPNLRNTITIKQTPLIQKQKQMNEHKKMSQQLLHSVPIMINNDYQMLRGSGNASNKSLETKSTQFLANKGQQQSIAFKKVEAMPVNIEYGYTTDNVNQNKVIDLRGGQERTSMNISLNNSMKTLKNDETRQTGGQTRIYASPINRYELNKQFNQLQHMMSKYPQALYSQPNANNRIVYRN